MELNNENARQMKEKKFWDAFAKKYDPFMDSQKTSYDLLLNRIRKYITLGTDVLEIATGTGNIALAIAGNARTVSACDISSEMISVAEGKLRQMGLRNVEFQIRDAYQLDYQSGKFDVVIASNVLHIMIDPARALASIHDVLKDGGVLIAPTYCHGENIASRAVSQVMALAGFKAYHKWSVKTFRNFLEMNRYQIIELEVFKDIIPMTVAVAKKK
jgi:ubiquinone/menaquinone biosynthesis C-methylase UbiE